MKNPDRWTSLAKRMKSYIQRGELKQRRQASQDNQLNPDKRSELPEVKNYTRVLVNRHGALPKDTKISC